MTVLRILVLAHSQPNIDRMMHPLRQAGFAPVFTCVKTASDFEAGFNDNPALILSNFTSSGFGALDALHILREKKLAIPLIVVAETPSIEDAVVLMKQGAADYVPLERLEQLASAVSQALAQKHRREIEYLAGENDILLPQIEERFRQIVNHVPIMIWVSDAEGFCNFFNRPWLEFTGRTLEQEHGYGWTAHVHPDDLHDCLNIFHAALHSHEPFVMEYRLKRADGEYRWIRDTGIPGFDAAGKLTGFTGSCIDITERKKTEAALQESQHRLQALFDNTQDAILLIDDMLHIVAGNPAACELLGYTEAELAGMPIQQITPPENHALLPALWQTFLAAGRLNGEYIILRKDGMIRTIDFRAVARILPGLHLSSVRDISERRQTETALRQMAAIIESSQDAIISKTLDARILSWNAGAEHLYQYRADQVIGQSIAVIVPPEKKGEEMQIIDRVVQGERIESYETVRVRKDGQRIHVSLTVSPVRDERGVISGASAIARDITERKRVEAELQAYTVRSQALAGRILSSQEEERRHIARELHDEAGQLLTALKINLEHALSLSETPTRQPLTTARSVVNELMIRIRNLSLDLRPPMLDDLGLLAALAWLFERYTTQTQVRVMFRHPGFDERFAPQIETAAYRMIQEALTNVARHAGSAEAVVRLWIDENRLMIQVEDIGAGFNVDPVLSGWHTGGLVGIRERASLLNGQMTIESAPGQGCCITVQLPLQGWPTEQEN